MNKKEAILKVYNCIKKETAKKAISIELKKQNNTDMKNWSVVQVEEDKATLDNIPLEMDPLYRDSSMRKAEIFMADGVSLTQILEILMQLAQYI